AALGRAWRRARARGRAGRAAAPGQDAPGRPADRRRRRGAPRRGAVLLADRAAQLRGRALLPGLRHVRTAEPVRRLPRDGDAARAGAALRRGVRRGGARRRPGPPAPRAAPRGGGAARGPAPRGATAGPAPPRRLAPSTARPGGAAVGGVGWLPLPAALAAGATAAAMAMSLSRGAWLGALVGLAAMML